MSLKVKDNSENSIGKSDMMQEKSDKMEEKSDKMEDKSNKMEAKLNIMEEKSDKVEAKSNKLEKKSDKMEEKSDKMEAKLNIMEEKSDKVEAKSNKLEEKSNIMEEKSNKMEAKLNIMDEKSDKMEGNSDKTKEEYKPMVPLLRIFTPEDDELESISIASGSSVPDRAIILNIRGECFLVEPYILRRIPGSRLDLLTQDDNLGARLNKEGEVFFNKDPIMFGYIMDLYKDNVLHIPKDKCVVTIQEDLMYWGIDDALISPCCRKRYFEGLHDLRKTEKVKKELASLKDDIGSNMIDSPRRRKLAIFLHKQNSSVAAKIWSYIFPMMLFISVGLIFCTTHENFREPLPSESAETQSSSNNKQVRFILNTRTYTSVTILELICCVFFTVELFLRAVAYSTNFRRMLSVSTLCHLIYLIPAWISLFLHFMDTNNWIGDRTSSLKLTIHVVSIMRVFHLQRLVLQSRELMVMWLALRSSCREIALMLVLVLTVCVVSASLMFVTDLFIDSSIKNMFTGLWWTIITITTVGYGDQHPRSWPGYAVASVCAVTGVIITGMSIPLITKRFHNYYQTRLLDDLLFEAELKQTDSPLAAFFKRKHLH